MRFALCTLPITASPSAVRKRRILVLYRKYFTRSLLILSAIIVVFAITVYIHSNNPMLMVYVFTDSLARVWRCDNIL